MATVMIQTGTARVGSADLYYEVHGRGDPVILLHSGMASLREWDPVLPLLREHYAIVVFDRAGIGRSSGLAFERDIVDKGVEEVAGLMRHLDVERARLLGSCLGGAIALCLASRRPHLVQSVMSTGVLFRGGEALRGRLATLFRPWTRMPVSFQQTMRRVHGVAGVESAYERFRQMYTGAGPVGYASSPDYDIRREVVSVPCPVLLAHGDRDPFWGVDQPAGVYRGMERAALSVVPFCAHYPHLEHPTTLAAQARAFFAEELTCAASAATSR
jgi:pimeloyl-ACP methyl ester carboxylesterase